MKLKEYRYFTFKNFTTRFLLDLTKLTEIEAERLDMRDPVLTSSGRIHPVAVGDHVYLVEDIQYRITKLSPDSDSVCPQKINSRDRPFKRSIRQIWLPPPITSDSFASADLPATNCFCPEPLPPPVLPDVMDTSIQADMDKESALNDWVTVTTDFSSVTQLDKTFQDARREAGVFYDMFTEADLAAASARKQVEHLTSESQQLRSSLDDLNRTHNSLMADSLRHLKEISSIIKQYFLENYQPYSYQCRKK